MFEKLTDLVVDVEIASDLRYRNTNDRPGTAVLAISQSSEMADTIVALREAERKGALLLGLVNVVGSTISALPKPGSTTTPDLRSGWHRRKFLPANAVFSPRSRCCWAALSTYPSPTAWRSSPG